MRLRNISRIIVIALVVLVCVIALIHQYLTNSAPTHVGGASLVIQPVAAIFR
jgi:hypothetical protein